VIVGTGIDAASVARTRELIGRFGARFTHRVFTAAERGDCERRRRPGESYAARFAAKEAVMKALGAGWGSGVRFQDIEVGRGERGRPQLHLAGGAAARAAELGIERVQVSLSHHEDLALAVAIAEGAD
jgi:holo-[acyl-carrier protein] synthase